MKRTSLLLSALLALCIFTLTGTVARADATDFEFARGLMDRGYLDLAEQEFQRIIGDGSKTDDERREGELGLCYLKAKVAIEAFEGKRREDDPAPILRAFALAQTAFEDFFRKFPTHPKVIEAKDELGRLLQNEGGLLAALMKETDDPVKTEEYKSLALRAFDDAIALYDAVIQKFQDDPDNWIFQMARFRKGIAIYNKGLIYPPGELARQSELDKAKAHWEQFIWDYDGFLMGAFGYMYMGLCHKALGENGDAMEYLQTAAGIDVQGDTPEEQDRFRDLILRSYYFIGQLGSEVGEEGGIDFRALAADALSAIPTKVPEALQMQVGHFALLELAKLRMGQKKFKEALAAAQRISDVARTIAAPWAAGTRIAADRLIGEIMSAARAGGHAGLIKQDPEVLWRAAEGKLSQRDFVGAAMAYHDVIQACGDDPAQLDRQIDAWLKVCLCFRGAEGDRYYEAAAAAQYVVDHFPDHPKAGEAAYEQYRALNYQYDFSRDPSDKDLRQAARRTLTGQYGNHEKARDLQYYDALEFYKDGDRRLGAAQKAESEKQPAEARRLKDEAKSLFEQAVKALSVVDVRSANFELAQAYLGQTWYKIGEMDPTADAKALQILQDYLKNSVSNDPRWRTTDPDRLAKREQARARAAYYIAKVHERRDRWNDVLTSVQTFLKDYERQTEWHPYVLLMMVEANLKTGRSDPAEVAGAKIWDDFRDDGQTRQALYFLGRHFDERQRNTTDAEEKRAALTKAADYFKRWLDLVVPEDRRDPQFLQSVGNMYRELGNLEMAEKMLALAYDNIAKSRGKVLVKDNSTLLYSLAQIFMARDKPIDAQPLLERLACVDGDDPEAVKAMGKALEMEPRTVQPSDLQKHLTASVDYLKALIECYANLGEGGYVRAINLCRRLWRGVGQMSDEWFWAKYYYILMWYEIALAKQDKIAIENARETLKNLTDLKLIRRCKDATLREKFERLQVKVEELYQRLK